MKHVNVRSFLAAVLLACVALPSFSAPSYATSIGDVLLGIFGKREVVVKDKKAKTVYRGPAASAPGKVSDESGAAASPENDRTNDSTDEDSEDSTNPGDSGQPQ